MTLQTLSRPIRKRSATTDQPEVDQYLDNLIGAATPIIRSRTLTDTGTLFDDIGSTVLRGMATGLRFHPAVGPHTAAK